MSSSVSHKEFRIVGAGPAGLDSAITPARAVVVDDAIANRAAVGAGALISGRDCEVEVWVIPVDEARILAEEAVAVVRPPAAINRK